jgi:hypothetical protein
VPIAALPRAAFQICARAGDLVLRQSPHPALRASRRKKATRRNAAENAAKNAAKNAVRGVVQTLNTSPVLFRVGTTVAGRGTYMFLASTNTSCEELEFGSSCPER